MSVTRELVFDWLSNASVQIALFAVFAAVLSPYTAKAKAKYQYCLYLSIFALCLAAPVFNTLWHKRPNEVARKQPIQSTQHSGNHFWLWNGHSSAQESTIPAPAAKTALLVLWQMLFLYQVIHFSRGIYRVRQLRRGALLISPDAIGLAGSRVTLPHRVVLLQSATIDEPVAVGVFHPAIPLPSKLIPVLDEPDLTAILAHEYGHIRRKDFLVHMGCQLATLPVAWHPGIRYLMSKISQTRELPAMITPLFASERGWCMPAHSHAWHPCACKYVVAAQWGWVSSMVTTWRIDS